MFGLTPWCTVKANSSHSIQTRERCAVRLLFSVPLHPTKYLASFSLLPASTSRRVLPPTSSRRHHIASSFSIHSLNTAAPQHQATAATESFTCTCCVATLLYISIKGAPIKRATSPSTAIFRAVTLHSLPLPSASFPLRRRHQVPPKSWYSIYQTTSNTTT